MASAVQVALLCRLGLRPEACALLLPFVIKRIGRWIWFTIPVACVIGLRAKSFRTHDVLGVIALFLQVLTGFAALPRLGV